MEVVLVKCSGYEFGISCILKHIHGVEGPGWYSDTQIQGIPGFVRTRDGVHDSGTRGSTIANLKRRISLLQVQALGTLGPWYPSKKP